MVFGLAFKVVVKQKMMVEVAAENTSKLNLERYHRDMKMGFKKALDFKKIFATYFTSGLAGVAWRLARVGWGQGHEGVPARKDSGCQAAASNPQEQLRGRA